MMVMWSRHDGANDESGQAVVSYMIAAEFEKALPGGARVLEVRNPPPELLAGDPANMRRAIKAVPFKRRYSSAVLSFHRDDIDVAAFNGGDATVRRQVAEVISAFESAAFAGIEPGDRPPMLWTTHTHTGRLELNFVCPRAILLGDKLRSINPNPPGRENRATWDAFRDVFNMRYGWANPDDPARKRLVAIPDHVAKANALRERLGQVPQRDGREVIAKWVVQRIEAGAIQNRADVVAQLREQGFIINREGKEYVSVRDPDPGNGAKYRLRGPIFSSSFTSIAALGVAGERGTSRDRRGLAGALQKAEQQLARHLDKRTQFNRNRYQTRIDQKRAEDIRGGMALGPDSPPCPVVEFHHDCSRSYLGHGNDGVARFQLVGGRELAETRKGQSGGRIDSTASGANRHHRQIGHLGTNRPARDFESGGTPRDVGQGSIASRHPRGHPDYAEYKAKLWTSLYDDNLPRDLFLVLLYVDTSAKVVRLTDGSEVRDHGDRLTSTGATLVTVRLMLAEARAKDWKTIAVEGSEHFKRLVASEIGNFAMNIASIQMRSAPISTSPSSQGVPGLQSRPSTPKAAETAAQEEQEDDPPDLDSKMM